MIDTEAVRHQVLASLPTDARWLLNGIPLAFSFARATARLEPLDPSEVTGPLELEWRSLHLFGEQDYADGGGATPFIGVDVNSGKIIGLDLERDTAPLSLFNSNIDAFIRTFRLLDDAFRREPVLVHVLEAQVRQIDPAAFSSSEWARLLEFLAEL